MHPYLPVKHVYNFALQTVRWQWVYMLQHASLWLLSGEWAVARLDRCRMLMLSSLTLEKHNNVQYEVRLCACDWALQLSWRASWLSHYDKITHLYIHGWTSQAAGHTLTTDAKLMVYHRPTGAEHSSSAINQNNASSNSANCTELHRRQSTVSIGSPPAA